MNYARLEDWAKSAVDALVALGVPESDAMRIIDAASEDAVNSASRHRKDKQFLLDFAAIGSKGMAEKYGKTPQAMRKRRQLILSRVA